MDPSSTDAEPDDDRHDDDGDDDGEPDVLRDACPLPEFDDRTAFDEAAHVYTDVGTRHRYGISVTGVVHRHFPTFDARATLARMRSNPVRWAESRYAGFTDEQIIAGWDAGRDDASSRGRAMHACFERFLKRGLWNRPAEARAYAAEMRETVPEIDRFLVYVLARRSRGWQPLRAELRVADLARGVAGMIDCLLWHPTTRRVAVVDWKRTKEIRPSAFNHECALPPPPSPLALMPHCNQVHYGLQVNLYARMLETIAPERFATSMSITECELVTFPPPGSVGWQRQEDQRLSYLAYMVPRLRAHADWMLDEWAKSADRVAAEAARAAAAHAQH